MRKILFVARLDEHIRHFHIPYLKWFTENGFTVDVASDAEEKLPYIDSHFEIAMKRNPLHPSNIRAYFSLKKLIDDNEYDIVHCHMPLSGILTRLAARKKRRKGLKVLYTAHGFHFFKGASLLNWLVYYPIEKITSFFTDSIITINNEDYQNAKNRLHAKNVELVNGVGIKIDKFTVADQEKKKDLREKNNLNKEDFILIYVAELSHRKHQDLLIESVKLLSDEIPNLKLLLVGKGSKEDEYRELISELNLKHQIQMLGYRTDVDELMNLSDVVVSSSRQEGLPVNIMEAMGTGLPIVASDCRGNRDLVTNGVNGYIVESNTPEEMADSIRKLSLNPDLRLELGSNGRQMVKKYSIENVLVEMIEIYKKYLSI